MFEILDDKKIGHFKYSVLHCNTSQIVERFWSQNDPEKKKKAVFFFSFTFFLLLNCFQI